MELSRANRLPAAGGALAVALLLAAAGATAAPPTLVGGAWVAEDIGGKGVIDDLQSRITFTEAARAQGTGGCNNFNGGYQQGGATLVIGPLASTMKACPPAIMDQEGRFHEALGATRGYRIEQGLLYLLDGDGKPLMRLSPGK
jgi:heat shock protein HslJ